MKNQSKLPLILSLIACIGVIILAFTDRYGTPNTGQNVQQSETAFGKIKTQKRIVAGWAPYAPYASMNLETKVPEGFYVELFDRMADEAGLEVEWVETTWSTMIADLAAGRFQVMAAPVFRTIPRSREVGFTRTIDFFGLSAVVKADDQRFSSPLDFNRDDITISVVQGEVGHEFATRRLPRAKLKVHKSGDIAIALVDVIEGHADVGICDAWTARLFSKEHSGVRDLFGQAPFNRVGAGWFVRNDELELLHFLNTSIDWLESSGVLTEVASKYELPSAIK